MSKLTGLQERILKELSHGGNHIARGHYGGYTGFICNARGSIIFHAHGGSIKALLKRGLIQDDQAGLVISDAGRGGNRDGATGMSAIHNLFERLRAIDPAMAAEQEQIYRQDAAQDSRDSRARKRQRWEQYREHCKRQEQKAMIWERLAGIEGKLNDLGDVSAWRDEVDDYGDLVLHLPPQFRWENDRIIFGNMEGSTAEDHALLEFLGAAPAIIKELVAHIKVVQDQDGPLFAQINEQYKEIHELKKKNKALEMQLVELTHK